VLHKIAARDADIPAIVAALERGADPNAKNAAGQNFFHVLPRRFLRSLADNDWNGLIWVLQRLNRFKIRFEDCDAFGRNFFHLVTHRGAVLDRNELQVLKFLHIELIPSRDAFGWEPTMKDEVSSGSSGHGSVALRCPGSPVVADLNLSGANYRKPLVEKGSSVSALLNAEAAVSSEEQAFLSKHARLIEAARMAFEVPKIEDLEGRNGLQCLAEASLTLSIDSENTPSGTSNKRKRGQADADASSMRLVLRYELVEQLIAAGVSLNNYDKQGNTVLMSFLTHLHDGEDDKTLAKLLRHIIQGGADIHLRNRHGESALHVAVRLGRKVATRILLENGANVHARTLEGKGVLEIGELHYFKAREDQALYASIHACMALTIQYGAKAAPSLVQEWQLCDDE
jgi:ankyrin repeat protein